MICWRRRNRQRSPRRLKNSRAPLTALTTEEEEEEEEEEDNYFPLRGSSARRDSAL